jgi:UDP-glucose 6-dehydrogenase
MSKDLVEVVAERIGRQVKKLVLTRSLSIQLIDSMIREGVHDIGFDQDTIAARNESKMEAVTAVVDCSYLVDSADTVVAADGSRDADQWEVKMR